MKHKIISTVLLAAVLALLLAVPAAADRKTHPVTFTITDYVEPWVCEGVADFKVLHCTATTAYTIVSDDPLLDGTVASGNLWCTIVLDTPAGGLWGPCEGKLRYVAPLAGANSGWEGIVYMQPWTDVTKWPRTGMVYVNMRGFGAYAKTQAKFEMNNAELIFTGAIYGLD